MSPVEAAVLGIVQGLTEFLPVSSSGHLVLGQRLLGVQEPSLLFDVAVHVGTLIAVLAVFRQDLWEMAQGLWQRGPEGRRGRRLIWLVAVGSVPTAIIGLVFKDHFEAMFSSTLTVGISLLITGSLLMVTGIVPVGRRGTERTGAGRALIIGIAQGTAITPGISRSGATIATALLLGVDRKLAALYSFLLSIPAILGALALQLRDVGSSPASPWGILVLGGAVAGVTGYAALRILLRVVQAGRLHWFAPYCWALGLAALAWSFWG